jgi:predicted phosphodiesterase
MEIAVISDLHLGSGGAADGFGHEDNEFCRFLTFLENNFERIVLLGDVWETLASSVPGDAASELERARICHPEIAQRFRTSKYTYIHGNHDLVAGAVDVAPEEWVLEADGVRVLFTHGHQNDDLFQRRRWLSELGVWLGGWVRRVGMQAFYRMLLRMDALREGATRDSSRCPFQKWAVRLAQRRNIDVVVTGHTHLATRAEHGTQLFLNSGSCAGGEISFLAMDTRRALYQVCSSF